MKKGGTIGVDNAALKTTPSVLLEFLEIDSLA
jgi:hypothetical protein